MKKRKTFLKILELVVLFRTEYSIIYYFMSIILCHLSFYVNYFTSTQYHKVGLKRELLDLFRKERERKRVCFYFLVLRNYVSRSC